MRPLLLAGLLCGLAGLVPPTQAAPQSRLVSASRDTLPQRMARFNQSLEQESPAWRQEPVLLALLWTGPARSSQRTISYQATPAENPTKATVTVTEDALPDDSIAATRTRLSFAMRQGRWTLVDVNETWRCRRGTAQKEFKSLICP